MQNFPHIFIPISSINETWESIIKYARHPLEMIWKIQTDIIQGGSPLKNMNTFFSNFFFTMRRSYFFTIELKPSKDK